MAEKTRRQKLEEMLAEDPSDSFLRYGLAMDHAGSSDDEGALRCLRELLQLDPNYVPAYLQAGQVLMRLGRDDEAREVFQTGIATGKRLGDLHAAGEMEGFLESLG